MIEGFLPSRAFEQLVGPDNGVDAVPHVNKQRQ